MVSATNVFVSTYTYQADTTAVIEPYYENSTLGTTSSPLVNTQISQPSGSGTSYITKRTTQYLWSPQFGNGQSLPSGILRLDFWASGTSSLAISVYATNAAGSSVNTLGSSSVTMAKTETEYVLNFTIPATNVPVSGYISVSFSLASGKASPISIYWGASQETNFQIEEFRGVVD
ncbi:MAG: hypothetical protein M1597_00340 [Candidatus Thermoplasmatota archaeon]|nr:hypothetical protein [Candidatus Thermoplasmatota archaeon]